MKIEFDDFINWFIKLYEKPKDQRVGQWFCNWFKIKCSSLFYETSDNIAMNKIMKRVDIKEKN